MIAVRMGNKCSLLGIPWVEPERVFGQMNASLEPDIDHGLETYDRTGRMEPQKECGNTRLGVFAANTGMPLGRDH